MKILEEKEKAVRDEMNRGKGGNRTRGPRDSRRRTRTLGPEFSWAPLNFPVWVDDFRARWKARAQRACRIRPQPADLESLDLTAHTIRGPIRFASRGTLGRRELRIRLPAGCPGELVVDPREQLELQPLGERRDLHRYLLPPGQELTIDLAHT